MQLSFTEKKNIRKNFGKLKEGLSIPNLIEVQKNSYNEFLSSKTLDAQMNELSKGIDKKPIIPNIYDDAKMFGIIAKNLALSLRLRPIEPSPKIHIFVRP